LTFFIDLAVLLRTLYRKTKIKFTMSKKDIQPEDEIKNKTEEAQVETATETSEDKVEDKVEGLPEATPEEKLEEELSAEKDKYLRLFAEFENYKRRTAKERIELFKTANTDIMMSMLPVLDDFDRAWIEIEKSDDENLKKGVELIRTKLKSTLESKGLTLLDVRKGDDFNADFHEAITQIPAPSDDLKGKIVDVIEKGYKLGDKIIRYPKVVIGQ